MGQSQGHHKGHHKVLTGAVTGQSQGQSLSSHRAVTGQSQGSHRAVTGAVKVIGQPQGQSQSKGSHRAVIGQPQGSHRNSHRVWLLQMHHARPYLAGIGQESRVTILIRANSKAANRQRAKAVTAKGYC